MRLDLSVCVPICLKFLQKLLESCLHQRLLSLLLCQRFSGEINSLVLVWYYPFALTILKTYEEIKSRVPPRMATFFMFGGIRRNQFGEY